MKRLRPSFQRSLATAGVVGICMFSSSAAVHAGTLQSPPSWIPYEREAISLYLLGMSQESSDPQAAVKTLSKARQESFAAIENGGGANQAVQHNDALIGQALMLAQADAAKAPQNNNQPAATEIQGQNQNHSQKSNSNKSARPSSNHNSQVTLRGR